MMKGTAIWAMMYGGFTILVWMASDWVAALTFLAGLGVAVLTVMLADRMTRER